MTDSGAPITVRLARHDVIHHKSLTVLNTVTTKGGKRFLRFFKQ